MQAATRWMVTMLVERILAKLVLNLALTQLEITFATTTMVPLETGLARMVSVTTFALAYITPFQKLAMIVAMEDHPASAKKM